MHIIWIGFWLIVAIVLLLVLFLRNKINQLVEVLHVDFITFTRMTGEESHEYVLRQYRQAISLIWFRLSRFIRAKADKPEDLEFTDKLLNVMQSIFECEGASYDCDLRKKQLEFWSTHKHKEWDVENYTRFTITDVPLDILRDMLSIKQTVWPFVR